MDFVIDGNDDYDFEYMDTSIGSINNGGNTPKFLNSEKSSKIISNDANSRSSKSITRSTYFSDNNDDENDAYNFDFNEKTKKSSFKQSKSQFSKSVDIKPNISSNMTNKESNMTNKESYDKFSSAQLTASSLDKAQSLIAKYSSNNQNTVKNSSNNKYKPASQVFDEDELSSDDENDMTESGDDENEGISRFTASVYANKALKSSSKVLYD